MTFRSIASMLLAVLCSVPAQAQTIGDINDRIAKMSSLGKTDAEYRLGPGDLIEVAVFGVDSYRHTLRISASGTIKLPLMDAMTVTGITAAELEKRVAAALDGDVIKNPQVSVFVKEYRSQPVFVLGAVKTPGQYVITQQLNLVDVLAMAGGLLPNAGDEALLQRPVSPGGDSADAARLAANADAHDTLKINLRELLEKGDMSLNIRVKGGDVIHIQERLTKLVYVIGEVNHAGVFPLPAKQELRVSQAFGMAGGPMKTAKMSQGMLVRYTEKGERQEVAVDFEAILKGTREDFFVRADDVIFVPGSKVKNIGYGLLGVVPQLPVAALWRY